MHSLDMFYFLPCSCVGGAWMYVGVSHLLSGGPVKSELISVHLRRLVPNLKAWDNCGQVDPQCDTTSFISATVWTCRTWGALHVNHKVMVGDLGLCKAGAPAAEQLRAEVELRPFRALLLLRRQHIGFGCRGWALQLHGAGVFWAADLQLLQFRQTPVL